MQNQARTDEATLTGETHIPADLPISAQRQMFHLLSQFFENVTWDQFQHDLSEKEWVFLFRDAEGTIQGFSTLMRIRFELDGEIIVAFYSGDTIIHPDFWHEMELPRLWGGHVFSLADQIYEDEPSARVYWFLISSGYKTYRFLPVFFRTFYPSYRQPTPSSVQAILEKLGRIKFGDRYESASGVIRMDNAAPLKSGVAELSPRRLKNRDIAFFAQVNPGHARGDQLACLVEINRANVTRAGKRMLAGS